MFFVDTYFTNRESKVWVFCSACPKGSVLRSTIINLRRCDTPIRAPDFASLARQPDGTAQLVFSNGFPTVQWKIQTSDNLATWSVGTSTTETSPGVFEFTDLGAAGLSKRFYRLRAP